MRIRDYQSLFRVRRGSFQLRRALSNVSEVSLVLDVDGVFTDGTFLYSSKGKVMKTFGSHDWDALSNLPSSVRVICVSADKKGFPITSRRFVDAGIELQILDSLGRANLVRRLAIESAVIFVGDSWTDRFAVEVATFSVAPLNGDLRLKRRVNFVTNTSGGQGAVAEVCWLLELALGRRE